MFRRSAKRTSAKKEHEIATALDRIARLARVSPSGNEVKGVENKIGSIEWTDLFQFS